MLEGLEQMEPGEMVRLMEGFGPEEGMLRFNGARLDPEHTSRARRTPPSRGTPRLVPPVAHIFAAPSLWSDPLLIVARRSATA